MQEQAAGTQPSTRAMRVAAVGLVVGTLLYIVPSAVHGNPPIDDARSVLGYVAERPTWRAIHLVNILAVLVWLGSFALLGPVFRDGAAAVSRVARVVLTVAAAVFAVYFSIHAFGLSTAADAYFAAGADQAAVLERTETVLILLGSIAFTAQAMLGLGVLLYGVTVARTRGLPSWLGWVGAVAGAGWLVGAVAVEFAVIVPFTVVTWVWTIVLGVALFRAGRRH